MLWERIPQVNYNSYIMIVACLILLGQGRPHDLAGGGARIFFPDLEICMSRSDMLRMAKAMRFARGVRGHAPSRKNFKMVQFGAFWCIF